MSGEDAPAQQQNAEEQKQQQQETKTPAESPKTESKPDPPPTSASTEAAAAAAADDTPAPAAEKAPEEDTFSYRALVLTGYGGYDKVKLQVKKGKPALKSGEVMVRVKMCGLNFADLMARQGLYDRLPSPPVTPGMECSGIIEAVGEDVTDRKPFVRAMPVSSGQKKRARHALCHQPSALLKPERVLTRVSERKRERALGVGWWVMRRRKIMADEERERERKGEGRGLISPYESPIKEERRRGLAEHKTEMWKTRKERQERLQTVRRDELGHRRIGLGVVLLSNWTVGDKVLVLNRSGMWQEVVVVATTHTFLMPEGMSFEEAAALPVNYITAYLMLFDFGHLRPNQSVLIHMAAGKRECVCALWRLCKCITAFITGITCSLMQLFFHVLQHKAHIQSCAAGRKGALGLFTTVREYSSGLQLLTRSRRRSWEWISESLMAVNYFQVSSLRDFLLSVQVYVCVGVCWESMLSK
ncbi:hypothetical protein H4Q32_010288 [Labeo rohita]|uniref:Enoyl reductase (ER) domain-containing protein n=1 Tax=Labeo rohita TaxID=84645 RepID=A0ABQ8MUC1_LABRO|nr:hypothetical protein H4Q32_010288 [Labeo rohita]